MTRPHNALVSRLRLPLRFGVSGIVFAVSLMVMVQSAYAQTLFSNNNIDALQNDPTQQTVVILNGPAMISKITTYHWNNARGTTAIGPIALRSATGQLYGPLQAEGESGQGGVPNAYWVAYPNVSLPAGTYIVIDSDPTTWAQNAASGGAGMTWAEGYIQ
jgi:hypothetical protein